MVRWLVVGKLAARPGCLHARPGLRSHVRRPAAAAAHTATAPLVASAAPAAPATPSAFKNGTPGRTTVRRVAFPQRQRHVFKIAKPSPDPKPPRPPTPEKQQQHARQQYAQKVEDISRRVRRSRAGTQPPPADQRRSPSAEERRPSDEPQPEASTSGREASAGGQQQRRQAVALQMQSTAGKASKAPKDGKDTNVPRTAKGWQAHADWLIMSMEESMMDEQAWSQLAQDLSLEEQWRPQISLLWQLGMRAGELSRLLDSRLYVLKLGVPTLRRKLEFLRSVAGLNDAEIVRLLVKFPRILEYKTEKTIRSHLDFFCQHGVDTGDLSKVVLRAPMLLELSITKTLTPRIKFLIDTVAVPRGSIGKLITRHPQVMTCTEEGMTLRVEFLASLGLDRAAIGKAVLAHPQVLHYSCDAMAQRAQYMREVGMTLEQLAAAVSRLPQLLSLDVRNNMVPKIEYLTQSLGGDVATLSSYPAYLSLSLSNRIIPRHRFLEAVGPKGPPRPFPMSYLKCSDKQFAHNVAGSSLQRFEAFRSAMALS